MILISRTPTFVFNGSVLTNKTVTTCSALDALAVVRKEPYVMNVGSVLETGPESVDVISHQVQPELEATCTTPQAYVEQVLNFAASVRDADKTPSNSWLVGTLA